MAILKNEAGNRYGRLTVLFLLGTGAKGGGRHGWLCRCDCGKEVVVRGKRLRNGNTKSCGCLNDEKRAENGKKTNLPLVGKETRFKPKHALFSHPLYPSFKDMMRRCYSGKGRRYQNYGALGVSVFEPWHDVNTFIFGLEALLGPRPLGYSLDRVNPHGDYVEWNVRWADRKTQNNNQRNTVPDFYAQCGEH